MDQKINRICINHLYSENRVFDDIYFHDGINLILGEKYDESFVNGRKTNGVGKSMCIEFLDFCLLNEYDKSRLSKIPVEVLSMEEYILLDLKIGDNDITIKRNRKNHDKPIIFRNNKITSFNKIQDARNYLESLIFFKCDTKNTPSFRNLLSILIRDERSEFKDIIKCHDLTKRIPNDLTTHLFLLGISLDSYHEISELEKKKELLSSSIKENRIEITQNGQKKMQDVRAMANALNDEIKKMDEAIEEFKTNKMFDSIENEIIEIENQMDELRIRQKIIKHDYDKIAKLPKPEKIDDYEIELIYNKFKKDLGNQIVKSLEEVVYFKNKVEEFQRILVNKKAMELKQQLRDISSQLNLLYDEYSEKIKIIDDKGVLKNLKTSLKIYENKKADFSRLSFLFDEYDKKNKELRQLKVKRGQEIIDIDNDIENNRDFINDFIITLLDIHESIMGNKECSFAIETVDSKKIPVEINLRIYDDGSHSVDRIKVFIYDTALLFNKYTRERHPLFLVHDNIFDVDQDTLVQSLNFLYEQELMGIDFQYILTLNRDKIENEEKSKLINMDIDNHKVAVFTKQNKFLKRDYQETK